MSRKDCIRAVIGRWSILAASSIARALTALQHRSQLRRAITADLVTVVFDSPTRFVTIPLLIDSKGERRAPRFNY